MHILWLDPFHGGSHAAVATGYAAHSRHTVTLLTLPIAGGWRWRMRGGAVCLARMARSVVPRPDLIVASDMLDLATFRALTARQYADLPAAVYFHENQLTYPLPPGRQRDLSLAWINYSSALVADAVLFNSEFHRSSFLAALPQFLGRYHDYQELETIAAIAAKSHVLPPGIDLATLAGAPAPRAPGSTPPIILWNARWEYDKQPGVFFAAMEQLAARGVAFRLIVAGEHVDPNAPEFVAARTRWAGQIVHWGYAATRGEYASLLQRADIVVSCSLQEFFGIAVLEAMACGCAPVLPQRLNYPFLIPEAFHAECLYAHDADLADAIGRALARANPNRARWQRIAAPYAWPAIAPQYDAVFAAI